MISQFAAATKNRGATASQSNQAPTLRFARLPLVILRGATGSKS